MNRYIKLLIIILTTIILSGCINRKTEYSKKEIDFNGKKYRCIDAKISMDSYSSLSIHTISLEKNKLKTLLIETKYLYIDDKKYIDSCNKNKKEGDKANKSTDYAKYVVKCDEDKKTITVDKYYIIEKALKNKSIKSTLSYTLDYINKDGTFNLYGWKNEMKKRGSNCYN